jgi:hypothetical protein
MKSFRFEECKVGLLRSRIVGKESLAGLWLHVVGYSVSLYKQGCPCIK